MNENFDLFYTTYIPSQSWEQTQVSCINLNSLCLPATQYIQSHLLATSHVVFILFLSRSWKRTLILQWRRSMALSTCWDYLVSSSHLSAYTVNCFCVGWKFNLVYTGKEICIQINAHWWFTFVPKCFVSLSWIVIVVSCSSYWVNAGIHSHGRGQSVTATFTHTRLS